jgi:hypothetical protein
LPQRIVDIHQSKQGVEEIDVYLPPTTSTEIISTVAAAAALEGDR